MNVKRIYSLGIGLTMLGAAGFAHAAGTEAGTQVYNKATVNYQLGGAVQIPIESSPLGNSTAGENEGLFSAFTVDRKLDLNVIAQTAPVNTLSGYSSDIGGAHPVDADLLVGDHALIYDVTNLSNSVQDLRIEAFDNATNTVDNTVTDTIVTSQYRYFVDTSVDGIAAPNGTFDNSDVELVANPNGDFWLDGAPIDVAIRVFVVATIEDNVPAGAYANVTLVAQIHELDTVTTLGDVALATSPTSPDTHSDTDTRTYTNGLPNDDATAPIVDTILVDGQDTVDGVTTATSVATKSDGSGEIIFIDPSTGVTTTDAKSDGYHADTATYQIATSAITVTKTSKVFSDPFNGETDPIRIPGAVVIYTISVVNTGSLEASSVSIVDDIPTETTFVAGSVLINGAIPAGGIVTYVDPKLSVLSQTVAASDGVANTDANGALIAGADVLIITFKVTIN